MRIQGSRAIKISITIIGFTIVALHWPSPNVSAAPPPALGTPPAPPSSTVPSPTTSSPAQVVPSPGIPTQVIPTQGSPPDMPPGAPAPAPGEAAHSISPEEPGTPEVLIEAPEPKYVAPTLRDRIGRIWAPVLINGKGPFRLVLDTGASHSAIISHVADILGIPAAQSTPVLVRGVTGSAIVPAVHVDRMEVGDLLIEPSTLPIVPDVFGGAEGVLGREGLPDKRIFADFGHDRLVISISHRERAAAGFFVVPLRLVRGLLTADVRVGSIHAQAIIDTGGQQTVGNLALREALMRHPPKDAVSEEIIGVTLDQQRGDSIPTPPMAIGPVTLQGARVTFADMFLFEHLKLTHTPTLLLGMDVLGSFDVLVIDYRMREMQIRTRVQPAVR